jgi:glucans biosynthesis protein C
MRYSPQASATERHHDIDAARSVLMFVSVALHAGTVYAPARPHITQNIDRLAFFDWLIFGFHLFITPTFFFVGGFFTVILLRRAPTVIEFVRLRLIRAGIPLLSVALTLNVVENYLRWRDVGGEPGFLAWLASDHHLAIWLSDGWQLHLWFLVCLIPFFLLSAAIQYLLPAQAPLRALAVRVSDKVGGWALGAPVLLLFALAFANWVNFVLLAAIPNAYALLAPGFLSVTKLFSEFPFFVVGVMAALSPTMLTALRGWRGWMPAAALVLLVWQPYPHDVEGQAMGWLWLYFNQLAIWTIVIFILQFFHRWFSAASGTRAWLADAALSMYLLHHCLVYVYGRWLVRLDWHPGVEFVLLTAATAATVLLFHQYGIRRYGPLRLLFNGKTDVAERQRANVAAPAAERA